MSSQAYNLMRDYVEKDGIGDNRCLVGALCSLKYLNYLCCLNSAPFAPIRLPSISGKRYGLTSRDQLRDSRARKLTDFPEIAGATDVGIASQLYFCDGTGQLYVL